jgi:hypothetical protein
MPVANITEARDLVLGMLQTAWNALPTPRPPLFFQDQDDNAPASYATATIRGVNAGQNSLGGAGGIRYGTQDDLVVDIYTPFGEGANKADTYVIAVQGAFRGKKTIPDKVWFISVQTTPMPRKGAQKVIRVTVRYKYDELI